MEDPPKPLKPTETPTGTVSKERQKILDKAFAQLRKSRAAMDPGVINKIRRMIASNPSVMKALGITEELKPNEESAQPAEAKAPKAEQPKAEVKSQAKAVSKQAPKAKPDVKEEAGSHEKIDQAKNMEVMAKLMALNPAGKDKIKSAIKKAVD